VCLIVCLCVQMFNENLGVFGVERSFYVHMGMGQVKISDPPNMDGLMLEMT